MLSAGMVERPVVAEFGYGPGSISLVVKTHVCLTSGITGSTFEIQQPAVIFLASEKDMRQGSGNARAQGGPEDRHVEDASLWGAPSPAAVIITIGRDVKRLTPQGHRVSTARAELEKCDISGAGCSQFPYTSRGKGHTNKACPAHICERIVEERGEQ